MRCLFGVEVREEFVRLNSGVGIDGVVEARGILSTKPETACSSGLPYYWGLASIGPLIPGCVPWHFRSLFACHLVVVLGGLERA